MGRRSLHSPDELRRMILESSRDIVERDGIKGLSARAIAKKIGYSPGTLYNVFRNLDDLLLTIQVALLEDAVATLRAVPDHEGPQKHLRALAGSYLDFAIANRRLWNLLFQHTPSAGKQSFEALDQHFQTMIAILRAALDPMMRTSSPASIDQMARSIWLALHGISAIAVNDKTVLRADAAGPGVALVIEGIIASLAPAPRAAAG